MKKSTMIVCVVLGAVMMFVGVVLLDGSGSNYDDWETETLGSYEMSQVTAIRITAQEMNVYLYDGWEKTIRVDVSSRAVDRVHCGLGSDGVLTVEETALGNGGDINLWLPKGCIGTLTASTDSGELSVISVRGDSMEYTLTTGSGRLSTYGSRLKSLTAATESGDLSLYETEVYGPTIASTANGNMYIDNLEGQESRVTTVSGDVDIYNAQGTAMTVETSSGNITVQEGNIPTLSVITVSGDVGLDLPGTPEDYTVTLSTTTGHVDGIRERTGGTRALSVTTASGDVEASFYADGTNALRTEPGG